ncbi:MAG TPA: hypothetical protein VIR60_02250, partial [Gammaproteobacteria bacterium]
MNLMRRCLLVCLALFALAWLVPGQAGEDREADDVEIEELTPLVREFFPQAERFGPFGGAPRAAPVVAGRALVGYVYLT